MIYELLLITAIVSFGIDVAGFVETIKEKGSRWLGVRIRSLKPFDCSLCSTWWCCLLWLLCTRQFSLAGVALSAACALLAKPMGQALELAVDALQAIVHVLRRGIDKLLEI
jgi:hypothetical protein